MLIALRLGEALQYGSLTLPAALEDIHDRAAFIDVVDKPLLVDADGIHRWREFGIHLELIGAKSRAAMPEVDQDWGRVSIALRLWSGCLMAAKAIRPETRSGLNTAESRVADFQVIDAIGERDALFAAGVQAAPAFLVARGQDYSLDGVPTGSQVRCYTGA